MNQHPSQEMLDLVQQVNTLAQAYYREDAPLVSDREYDMLLDRLLALERQEGVVLPNSPSLRVGAEPLETFAPHTHIAPLYSMDKAQTVQELLDWEARIRRLIQEHTTQTGEVLPPLELALEYKLDGLTINLTYEDGMLVQAATRGNGTIGEAILPQVRTIRSIPLSIPYKQRIEIHGEAIMRLSALEEYNLTAKEPLKNARNGAAGALRNLDPAVTASRKLSAFFYQIGYLEKGSFDNQRSMMAAIGDWGLPICPYQGYYPAVQDLLPELERVSKARPSLDFLIDGMVIKVCDQRTREILGYTARYPRWAIAYKFDAEEMTTVVESITWQVGRTGKLTPVAQVSPVELAGVTVRRATLNNYDDILRKDVHIGSRVLIRRSNDVIPEIMGRMPDDQVQETDVVPPQKCPACSTALVQDGVHIYCPNVSDCPPQVISRLVHYAGRDAMDIETFAGKTAQITLEKLEVNTIADLYMLTREKLMTLPGFGPKKADNLLEAIQRAKTPALERFLFGLGIRNVGLKTAKDIVKHFGTLQAIKQATPEDLAQIEGVGDVVARSIADYFAAPQHQALIEALQAAGVEPQGVTVQAQAALPLAGKTFVLTGTLPTLDRREASALIEAQGGRVTSAVSAKTHYVVAGEKAGSKLLKAEALGIPVLDEAALRSLLSSVSNEKEA